jgi:hypothetical protein
MKGAVIWILIVLVGQRAYCQDFQQVDLDFIASFKGRFAHIEPVCRESMKMLPSGKSVRKFKECESLDSLFIHRQTIDFEAPEDSVIVLDEYYKITDKERKRSLLVFWTKRLIKDSVPFAGQLFYRDNGWLQEQFNWDRNEPGLRVFFVYNSKGRLVRSNYYRKGGLVKSERL